MKRLLLLFLFFAIVSCGPSKEEIEAREAETLKVSKHKPGDIVHIKPDSAKAVIMEIVVNHDCYCADGDKEVKYKVRDMRGTVDIVPEALIFEY
jgi:hypothetical protein